MTLFLALYHRQVEPLPAYVHQGASAWEFPPGGGSHVGYCSTEVLADQERPEIEG